MGLSEKIRQQLIANFKAEQKEHIQNISQGLLSLEKDPETTQRQDILNEIFRESHSLKGAARAVGMSTIESIGHAMEDVLLQLKKGKLDFTPELFDALYQSLDAIELVLKRTEEGHSSPPPEVLTLMVTLSNIATRAKEDPAPKAEVEAEKTESTKAEKTPSEEPESEKAEEVSTEKTESKPPASEPKDSQPESQEKSAEKDGVDEKAKRAREKTTPLKPKVEPYYGKIDETIRVSVGKLDTLMAQFSELLGSKIRIEQRLAEVREMQAFAAQWHKEWLALRGNYSRLLRNGSHANDFEALMNFTTTNQDHIRNLNSQTNVLYRQLANDTMRLSLVIDELQEEIKRVRMLPLATITTTFERMVRDLARTQDKQIRLNIIGDDTELDKRVLEQMKDPLLHLLRNAVDHGIEAPAEREKQGKSGIGTITLEASQQGHNVVITISDDGNGLDLEAIRNSAVRNGAISSHEADKLSSQDMAMLIFNSGLSTSKIITDISGRGVGLDVVRQNVAELHGTLNVDFGIGKGTTFTITLPLTLASSRGLLVKSGDAVFALPFSTVERMLEIDRSEVGNVEGRQVITYQKRPVALIWLEDLLELPISRRDLARLTVVVVGVAEKRLGIVVDSLEGEQEIVMKGLGKQLAKVGGIAGASVLGTGEVVLVLHTSDLVKLASRIETRVVATATTSEQKGEEREDRTKILVVDDSITTRTLEKNILEAAGYRVQLATNGEEAFSLLMTERLPSLIVSDINMPHLDGFQLTERVKGDPRFADIPIILVTSLDSPSDKAHGIEVGADAYIVKSHFDQGTLLETIEQLL